jgi:Ca2+-binding EF-hand superfamily protein
VVTFEEFVAMAKELTPHAGSNDELWKGFRAVDPGHHGRISIGLLQSAVNELPEPARLTTREVAQVVQAAAEYAEKGISFEEWKLFQVGLQQEFSKKKPLKALAA